MKKIAIAFFMLCSLCVSIAAQEDQQKRDTNEVQEAQQNKARELFKRRLMLVAKYPLKDHWMNLQSIIYYYLTEVMLQIDTIETVTLPFDNQQFHGFVNDVLVKLRMPSVTNEERDALLKDIQPYLSPDGHLRRLLTIMQLRNNEQEKEIIDALELMIAALEKINKTIELKCV